MRSTTTTTKTKKRSPSKVLSQSNRNRSRRGRKTVHEETVETREHQKGEINLWKEEWNTCPPSSPECFYYVWNFNHDNYYCPEEQDLLRKDLYSKYEIDDFLTELKNDDLHRIDKNPTGWYMWLAAFIIAGIGFMFLAIYFI